MLTGMTRVDSRIGHAALFALASAVFAWAPTPAEASLGDWAAGTLARARLIAAGIGVDGRLAAGIEVVIPPGWKTYWRSPGEAGIPPIFDFTGSRNLGPAEISFPVPHRFDDGYSVSNVYESRVVFLLDAEVRDPADPTELTLVLDLGVCEIVCVPDRLEARLTVPVGENDAVAGRMLADARDLLPGRPEPGGFLVTGVSRDGGTDKRPEFRVDALVPEASDAEVFIEGPDDWFADAPALVGGAEGRAVYRVAFSRLGAKTPIAGARFRVTIVSAGRAIEQTIGLDEPSQVE